MADTVYGKNPPSGGKSLHSFSGNFNHWSRHELFRTEHTDHWSKLRCKSYNLTKLPTGNTVAFCRSEDSSWWQNYARKKLGLPKAVMVTPKGTLAPIGCPHFNKYLIERLHNPHIVKPHPPKDSRGYDGENVSRAPSAYSQRAKLGFRYWFTDPQSKPASPGKNVTVGAKGTFLGIGVPRL